jgi:hypothetical protein
MAYSWMSSEWLFQITGVRMYISLDLSKKMVHTHTVSLFWKPFHYQSMRRIPHIELFGFNFVDADDEWWTQCNVDVLSLVSEGEKRLKFDAFFRNFYSIFRPVRWRISTFDCTLLHREVCSNHIAYVLRGAQRTLQFSGFQFLHTQGLKWDNVFEINWWSSTTILD